MDDLINKLGDRLIAIENTVCLLESQQDNFVPLLELIEESPQLLKLEEELGAIQKNTTQLEQTIANNEAALTELKDKCTNVQLPEAAEKIENYKTLQGKLLDVEATLNPQEVKAQMALKKVEISCKEECIKALQSFNSEIDGLKAEMETTQNEFVEAANKKINMQEGVLAELEKKTKDMETNFGDKLKAAEDFLTEDTDSFEDWVSTVLYKMVDEGSKELQEYLEHQYKKLSIKFHQELVSVTNQVETLRSEATEIQISKHTASRENPVEAFDALFDQTKTSIQNLDLYSRKNVRNVEDITTELNETIIALDEKARVFVGKYKAAQGNDQQRIKAENEGYFTNEINSIAMQISNLGSGVKSLEVNMTSELYKTQEALERLEEMKEEVRKVADPRLSMKVNDENLQPSLTTFKNHINEKLSTLDQQTNELRKRLNAIVKDLNRQSELDLKVEEREESTELFVNLRDTSPAKKNPIGGSSPQAALKGSPS